MRWCLEGACGTTGMATSLNRIAHGANWLHFRTLWEVSGLGDTALHQVLHASFGLAMALVLAVGWRRRGPFAGLLAAALFSALCLSSDLQVPMVYNHRPFPLLGALVTSLSLLAAERRSLGLALAMASVVGIATDIHMATATWFPAAAVVGALSLPRRPWTGAMIGAVASITVAVGIAPGAWWNNLLALTNPVGIPPSVPTTPTAGVTLPFWASRAAVGMTLLAFLHPGLRRRYPVESPALLALVAFPLLVLDGASLAGKVSPADKYLINIQAATALVLAGAVTDLGSRAASRLARAMVLPGPRNRWVAGAVTTGLGLLALAPIGQAERALGVDGLPMFREREVRAIADRLASHPDFLPSRRVFQVRESSERVLRSQLDFRRDWPVRSGDRARRVWTFLKTPLWELPDPGPPGLEVWQRLDDALVLALTAVPRLDWEHFVACEAPADQAPQEKSCRDTGMAERAPGEWRQDFLIAPLGERYGEVFREVRVPILPGPETLLASLPLNARCTATLSVQGLPEAIVDRFHRRVRLPALDEPRPEARLVARWTVGQPGCRAPETGMPPMIVEGAPTAVSQVWDLLEQHGLLDPAALAAGEKP